MNQLLMKFASVREKKSVVVKNGFKLACVK